ncbi:MAG TPA: hypothetical protein VEX86_27175 [Longimicrobium sp.]|nr:hypothetical protein [Longimicrobium sp.]
MRKSLAFLAALVLCAAPAAAQISGPSAPADAPAPAAVQQAAPKPALFPTADEVREQVRANEDAQGSRSAKFQQSQNFLYLVAAIVVGVVIAAVILD